jgi:hypothetical protein
MNNSLFFRLSVFGALLAAGFSVNAATYYVDKKHPQANDQNIGVEQEAPWATLSKAAQVLEAGDTVFVKSGIYNSVMKGFAPDTGVDAVVKLQNSGEEGRPIEFKAMEGETVVIEPGYDAGGFFIKGKSYITIEGFEIRYGGSGIAVAGGLGRMNGIRIVDNYIHHIGSPIANSSGIRLDHVDSAYVANNLVHNISNYGHENNNGMGVLSYRMLNVTFENNEFHTSDKGIYHKGAYSTDDTGIVIRNNLIYDTNSALEFHNNSTTDAAQNGTQIYQNIFVNNTAPLYDTTYQSTHENIGFDIYNNTFYNTGGLSIRGLSEVSFFSNIISGPSERTIQTVYQPHVFETPDIRKAPSFSLIDYNLYPVDFSVRLGLYSDNPVNFYSLSEWQQVTPSTADAVSLESSAFPPDTHSMVADAGFVDPLNYNFRLVQNSLAVGAGRNGGNIGAYRTGGEVIGLLSGFRHANRNSISPLDGTGSPPKAVELEVIN